MFQSARSISMPVAQATVITQYRCVQVNSSGEAAPVSGTTNAVIGVALEGSTDQQSSAISVALLDGAILTVEAGGNVTAGGVVGITNDGRVTNRSGSARAVGIALNGGSSGDEIRIVSGLTPATS